MTADTGSRSPQSGEFDDHWHDLLTGGSMPGLSGLFSRMPRAPRCKQCHVPFAGPYAPILRLLRFRPWPLNQQLCHWCYQAIGDMRGGAEVPVSLLFSDVRGSTTLAEQMAPGEYRSLLDRFFKMTFRAVDGHRGVIDHIVGDGVMAMWTKGFGGPDHPALAVEAGRQLVADLDDDPVLGAGLPAGVGVHTDVAWVGVVGETGAHDFTVLGDAPNTAARLGSAVDGGELVLSEQIAEEASVDTTGLEHRLLSLKGKAEPYPAWIEAASSV